MVLLSMLAAAGIAQSDPPSAVHEIATEFLKIAQSSTTITSRKRYPTGEWLFISGDSATLRVDEITRKVTFYVRGKQGPSQSLKTEKDALKVARDWVSAHRLRVSPKVEVQRSGSGWQVVFDTPTKNGISTGGLMRTTISIQADRGVESMSDRTNYAFPSAKPKVTAAQAFKSAQESAKDRLNLRLQPSEPPKLAYALPLGVRHAWTDAAVLIEPQSRVASLVYRVMLGERVSVRVDANTGLVLTGGSR